MLGSLKCPAIAGLCVLAGVGTLVAPAATGAQPDAAAARACGTTSVTLSPGDTRYAYGIRATRVTCRTARRVARAVTADPGEGGVYLTFRCAGTGHQRVACRKGRARITWRY